MKITKYPQSCLVIQKDGGRILIDPGTLATAEYKWADFGPIDAVMYTHRDIDHFDPALVDEILSTGIPIYGNEQVAEKIGADRIELVHDGDELVIAGFKVKARQMEHCLMVDGNPGSQNTGYLFDDYFLAPGDSTEDVGVKAEVVAAPVFGPDISFHNAYELVKFTGAKVAIPVHYDVVSMAPEGVKRFSKYFLEEHVKVQVLANGESTEI